MLHVVVVRGDNELFSTHIPNRMLLELLEVCSTTDLGVRVVQWHDFIKLIELDFDRPSRGLGLGIPRNPVETRAK